MNVLEFIGLIDENRYEEGGLSIGDVSMIDISDKVETHLNLDEQIHISYLISDVPMTKEEFIENRLKYLAGSVEIEAYDMYGRERTRYMWTEQKFKIGEHNLLEELSNNDGKYCYLKIYNTKAKRDMEIDRILK